MQTKPPTETPKPGKDTMKIVLFWSIVGIPLIYGVSMTVSKALELFH